MIFSPFKEEAMPLYRVWYQNKSEPLEFTSAGILREDAIVERVLAQENIRADSDAAAGKPPSLQELIANNNLAPVRYTEDESEPQTIA
jgi:hypothetical protein